MKFLSILMAWTLIVAPLNGVAQTPTKFQTDILQFGRGASALPKELIFDAGDGASNKKFSLDTTDNEVDLNTTLNVTGNLVAPTGQVNSSTLNVETTSTLKGDVTLGNGTNAQRTIQVNRAGFDPFLRWKESISKWVFSNDGTIEKPFGSGSGSGDGGINLLENPSFEDGIVVDWTSTCSSFTGQTFPNPRPNDATFARCVAAGSGEYFESVAKVIPTGFPAGCLASGFYNTSTNNAFTLQFMQGATVVNEVTLPTTNGLWLRTPSVAVTCPAEGQSVKLRVQSLSAATIDFDSGYLGTENRLTNIQQSRLAGASFFPGTASCSWSRANTSVGAFGPTAACPGPTVIDSSIGQWQTTDADLLRQTILNLPAGKYVARFTVFASSVTGTRPVLAINDGTTTCEPTVTEQSGNISSQVIECTFTYTSPGTRVFELYGANSSGSVVVTNDATTPRGSSRFMLEYYPNDNQVAVTNDQSAWFIDANIGGANPSLGTSSVASYSPIEDAGLDLVLKTGSASAQIGCSSTNPPTGTTCAIGNESTSISFSPPFTGWFDVCFDFSWLANKSTNGTVAAAFQVVETAVNSQTILTEGGQRTAARSDSGTTTTDSAFPFSVCGSFFLSSTTPKMFRLAYEQQIISGTLTGSLLFADRSASVGQRDIRVTARPSTMNIARPVLTGDQLRVPSTSQPKICSIYVINGGTASISTQIGGCGVSVNRTAAGRVTHTLTGFTTTPRLVGCVTEVQTGICNRDTGVTWSSTSIGILTEGSTTGNDNDSNYSLTLMGE